MHRRNKTPINNHPRTFLNPREMDRDEADRQNAVIGADPGDRGALVLIRDGAVHEIALWRWRPRRGAAPALRFLEFRPWARETVRIWRSRFNILALSIEQMFHRGGYASDCLKGYEINLQTIAAEFEIPTIPAPISSVKKYATGHGRAGKTEMRDALLAFVSETQRVRHGGELRPEYREYLRTALSAEGVADAAWIGLWAWRRVTGGDRK